jgi:2-polyprenyl-3-methyl-5-hydroxy-6-metoxy-1,4-benzoquinol methylase
MKTENYYNEVYFNDYQKKIGQFGGKANLFKFKDDIKKTDNVLDFGCGGGFLLSNIECNYKAGIEINPIARKHCINNLEIDCFSSISEVEDEKFDVIISNHALEHCERPFDIIKELKLKLKIGGKLIIVVPLDSFKYKFKTDDVNKHLYSFSPMNLGNILLMNEFTNIQTINVLHKWPPLWLKIQKYFGWTIFHIICYLYGHLNLYWTQTKAIGYK